MGFEKAGGHQIFKPLQCQVCKSLKAYRKLPEFLVCAHLLGFHSCMLMGPTMNQLTSKGGGGIV